MRIMGIVLIAAVVMLGSLQVGTQWSASLLAPRERGPAWFVQYGYPVYRPHQGLVWFVMADDVTMTVLLLPTGLGVGGVFIGALLLRSAVGISRRARPEQRIAGAQWATRADVRKGGLL